MRQIIWIGGIIYNFVYPFRKKAVLIRYPLQLPVNLVPVMKMLAHGHVVIMFSYGSLHRTS
jgi:hypothetical protein